MQRVIRCWSGPSGLVVVVEVLASSRGWYEVRSRPWLGTWTTVGSVGSQALALRVARAIAREAGPWAASPCNTTLSVPHE